MRISVRNLKDLWSGLLFIVLGLAFVFIAQDYPMGEARRMGPAYFPIILGFVLAGIGLIVAIRGLLFEGEPLGSIAIKPAVLITLATLTFGILIRESGIIAAVIAVVLISASASSHFRLVPSLLLAFGMAAFCVIVFVVGLGLPLPVLGVFGVN